MNINKISPQIKIVRKNLINILINHSQRLAFLESMPDKFEKQVIDIYSKNPYPSGTLSNFRRCSFVFDDVECSSIEGVLQSLKVLIPSPNSNYELWKERINLQKEICSYANNKAKREGNFLNLFNPKRELNWQGVPLERKSKEYQNFLKRLFEARYLADAEYRHALYDTRNFKLTHTIGKHDKSQTNLTEEEFIGMLNHLRTKFHIK